MKGAIIYMRDVAHVRDGNPPQTNIVRVDGQRAILMSIMKTGLRLRWISSRYPLQDRQMKGPLPPSN